MSIIKNDKWTNKNLQNTTQKTKDMMTHKYVARTIEIKLKVVTKDTDKTISIVLHFSLKCLYQTKKVTCHVFVS